MSYKNDEKNGRSLVGWQSLAGHDRCRNMWPSIQYMDSHILFRLKMHSMKLKKEIYYIFPILLLCNYSVSYVHV